MKKYIFRFGLAVLSAVVITGIYFGCTDDETNTFIDLAGRWSGWGQAAGGGGRIELQINQDTTGNITGFGYTFDEKMDTMAFTGTVSNGHVTVMGYTSQCRPTINLDVTSDGVKMTGTAQDIDSADCNMDPVNLLFYKVQEATVDITGSWNGSHTGTEGTGSFLMVINQSDGIVTGNIYDTSDTTSVTGRVLGNVFEGIVGDMTCPVLFYMEVNGSSMSGPFTNTGNNSECTDHGTVTASRVTGKQIRK